MLLVILILLIILNWNRIEPYEERHMDITYEKCAGLCKTTLACAGFGFDRENKICYLGRDVISGKPTEVAHRDQYSPTHLICNKLSPLGRNLRQNEPYTEPELKRNATYTCNNDKIYYHNAKQVKPISLEELHDAKFSPYIIKFHQWPLNKLIDEEIEPIVERDGLNDDLPVIHTRRIDKLPQQKEYGTEISSVPVNLPKDVYIIRPEKSVPIYRSTNKYNMGEYISDKYKCLRNIPIKKCFNYCTKNKDCVGVEWNPYYIEYRNAIPDKFNFDVCCPKKSTDLVNRKVHHGLGKYYTKNFVQVVPNDSVLI